MRADQALRAATSRLSQAGVDTPARDARRLLAHALQCEGDRLALYLADPMSDAADSRFQAAVDARVTRKPVAQIIGWREFYGRRFHVNSDVLDPRPDTEVLIDVALATPFRRVLDLGTGSGCILLTLLAENHKATGLGSDISPAALRVATENAANLLLDTRADLVQSNWFEAVTGQFDLIVANPPYISAAEMQVLAPDVRDHEPHLALTPGDDGLAAYRAIAAGAADYLTGQGRLIVEIGPTQAQAVSTLFQAAGLYMDMVTQDLDGRDRVITAHA